MIASGKLVAHSVVANRASKVEDATPENFLREALLNTRLGNGFRLISQSRGEQRRE